MILDVYAPYSPYHEYPTRLYLEPLMAYCRDRGITCNRVDRFCPAKGHLTIANADHWTPDKIRWFKENDCPVVAFNCIDSAYLSESLVRAPELALVDRIFTLAGVQKTNVANATVIKEDFSIVAEPRQFLPDDVWARFDTLRKAGKLLSLPYVPWARFDPPPRKAFGDKRPTLLFRGGNHGYRTLAYLMALHKGIADRCCGFNIAYYFSEACDSPGRYCPECRRVHHMHLRYPYTADDSSAGCNSPAVKGDRWDFTEPNKSSNRCPKSWFWAARKFAARHGPIDFEAFANALNFIGDGQYAHLANVADCRFYADCKWEFSIYAAQRFWEAACVGTVNYLPARAATQEYTPPMEAGEHYVTFADDLSDLSVDISEADYRRIADNAYDLWDKWMRPGRYAISDRLLEFIFERLPWDAAQ